MDQRVDGGGRRLWRGGVDHLQPRVSAGEAKCGLYAREL